MTIKLEDELGLCMKSRDLLAQTRLTVGHVAMRPGCDKAYPVALALLEWATRPDSRVLQQMQNKKESESDKETNCQI